MTRPSLHFFFETKKDPDGMTGMSSLVELAPEERHSDKQIQAMQQRGITLAQEDRDGNLVAVFATEFIPPHYDYTYCDFGCGPTNWWQVLIVGLYYRSDFILANFGIKGGADGRSNLGNPRAGS